MRALSVFTLITVASLALLIADSTKLDSAMVHSDIKTIPLSVDVDHSQVKRTLRRYISNDNEERGMVGNVDAVATKLDDVATKLDDVTGISKFDDMVTKTKKLPQLDLIAKHLDEIAEKSALGTKLSSRYKNADRLSLPTLRQLDEIEKLRATDIATYSKKDGKSMRRIIPDFPGKKTAPAKFLESHVGREQQRIGTDGSRLLASAVVYDPATERVLLISSSNPNKNDFLSIKGGWDHGESIEKATLREVMEEGGVRLTFLSIFNQLTGINSTGPRGTNAQFG
ncbi:RxLR effector protein [Phytophthora megakarya]|uniref:RxLR effector protein n=1 Tax=Phytophthora megakarya TaxID=4795 RepID=A0A225VBK5_9STRA|nr:RxLR effector protein [Phytophthora megakarya]